ncbi:MAG: NAD(P)/FAD-dependent oxidoreductase [Thermodesulfobacteria bacterium]|nr:NAD(P)/FAD-dependent oxidoreductase [Thermodesulfobacteriota bacterium]
MKTEYDIIILGCGPAGLQAAIHSVRKRCSVLVLGKPEASNLYKAHIENYCCVEGVKTGKELLEAGIKQAKGFGVDFLTEDAVKTEFGQSGGFKVETESHSLSCLALIIATGVSRKGLGLKGEKDLVGKGVSYCVDCDANFYRDAKVAVFGNGSAAVHGALTLKDIASKVHLITTGLDISPTLKETLDASKVEVYSPRKIKELEADDSLKAVILDDGTRLDVDGLFIELGAKGAMELAAFLGVQLDPEKFTHIVTDENQATNVPGIFAAGDICGLPYQMAKAVGEGCVAGLSAGSYCQKLKREASKNDT